MDEKKGIQIRVDKKWELRFTLPDGKERIIKAPTRAELIRKLADVIRKKGTE